MQLINIILGLLFAVLAAALPTVKDAASSALVSSNPVLDARQILMDGYYTTCCADCAGRYGWFTYDHAFDDLCTWLSGGHNLWTTEVYASQNYYCNPSWNGNVCIRLWIQYFCGGTYEAPVSAANPAGAMPINYAGCMGYFKDSITRCGSSSYPGGQVTSANKCWQFTTVGDDPSHAHSFSSSAVVVPINELHAAGAECSPDSRLCRLPRDSDGEVLGGVKAKFVETVEKEGQ